MIRVIIVDDHPVVRRGLKQIILGLGVLFRLPIWSKLYMLPSYYDEK